MTSDDLAPAAWRYLVHGEWFVTNIRGAAEFRQSEGCVVEPLYTTLAQSDAERRPDDNFERHLQARISKLEHEMEVAGLATRNPAPNAAPSSYSNAKTVTIGGPALAQSDMEPRDIREALADIRALEVRLAEQKQFSELLAGELKQARRDAQSDAEPVGVNARDIATKIASRPAFAKLIDTGALKFDEMCDLRDDIERALRARAADRSEPRPDASADLNKARRAAEADFRQRAADRSGENG